MKFIADMPVPHSTVLHLKQSGHDGYHWSETGELMAPDEVILSKAQKEKRVVLTMDLDYPKIIASKELQFPSIILFRLDDERPQVINSLLDKYLDKILPELEKGAIVVFEASRIRIRPLPIRKKL